MLDGGQPIADFGVVLAALHGQRPLRHLGNDGFGRQHVGHPVAQPKPVERGQSHNHCAVRPRLVEPRADVAPEVLEREVGSQVGQLGAGGLAFLQHLQRV